jgi:hypothetical protein
LILSVVSLLLLLALCHFNLRYRRKSGSLFQFVTIVDVLLCALHDPHAGVPASSALQCASASKANPISILICESRAPSHFKSRQIIINNIIRGSSGSSSEQKLTTLCLSTLVIAKTAANEFHTCSFLMNLISRARDNVNADGRNGLIRK